MKNSSEHINNSKIKILFLGTGAADWPEQLSDKTYDRNWRHYSSILVDDKILIDCGPNLLDSIHDFGVDVSKITDILLTHTHEDHLSIDVIKSISDSGNRRSQLRLWAHSKALNKVSCIDNVIFCPLEVEKDFSIDNYYITPLIANHIVERSDEIALHYLFECGNKRFLYATDGAWLLKPTWKVISRRKLDAIIWDATIGMMDGDYRIFEHNSISMIQIMIESLKNENVIEPDTHVIVTHMARSLYPSQEEIEKLLMPNGIKPAYDGLCIYLT